MRFSGLHLIIHHTDQITISHRYTSPYGLVLLVANSSGSRELRIALRVISGYICHVLVRVNTADLLVACCACEAVWIINIFLLLICALTESGPSESALQGLYFHLNPGFHYRKNQVWIKRVQQDSFLWINAFWLWANIALLWPSLCKSGIVF